MLLKHMLGVVGMGIAEGGKDGWIEGKKRENKGSGEREQGRTASFTEGTQGHKELLGK